MAFSGGTYTLPGAALNTGDTVSATENNTFRNDVATAFNLTMLRNGTSTATANLPMGGYKLTGLGNGTSSGDSLSYGQTADAVIYGLTIGRGAGSVSTNTAVGASALNANTTGGSNFAAGYQALTSNTTASNNTAVGYQAGYSQTTGGGNAGQNVFVGDTSGLNTTSDLNTFVGRASGYLVTTGRKNTIIGGYNGNQGGLDIRTSSNYIVLSDGDGNPRMWTDGGAGGRPWFNYGGTSRAVFNNTSSGAAVGIYVWYNAATPNNTASEFLYCDDASATRATIRSNGGIANYSGNNVNLSDRREKTNFAPAKSYLDVICAIPVQTFNYIDQNLEEDGGSTLGVVAQDVQAVAPELVMESNWAKEGDEPRMRLSIYQTDLQYALMKAFQELKAEFDAYKEAHP